MSQYRRKSPYERIQQFILVNPKAIGNALAFARWAGMGDEADVAQIVLWDFAEGPNPLVIEKPVGSGFYRYNPAYRNDEPELSSPDPLTTSEPTAAASSPAVLVAA